MQNFKSSISKENQPVYQNNSGVWPSEVYFRNEKIIQNQEVFQHNSLYHLIKGEKLHDHIIRCWKAFFVLFCFSEIVALIRCGPFGLRKSSPPGNEPLCLLGNVNLGRLEGFISVCQILRLQEVGHLFFLIFQGKPLKVTLPINVVVSAVAHTCEVSSLRIILLQREGQTGEKCRKTGSRHQHKSICGFLPSSSAFLGLIWSSEDRRAILCLS